MVTLQIEHVTVTENLEGSLIVCLVSVVSSIVPLMTQYMDNWERNHFEGYPINICIGASTDGSSEYMYECDNDNNNLVNVKYYSGNCRNESIPEYITSYMLQIIIKQNVIKKIA